MGKPKTRRNSGTVISEYIGIPKELNQSELPTNRTVLLKALLLKEENQLNARNYTNQQLSTDLAPLVIALWTKSNALFEPPVIIKQDALIKRIVTLLDKMKNVVHGRVKQAEKDKFNLKLDKLMDLTTCPHTIYLCHDMESGCTTPSNCKLQAHNNCVCPRYNKIPPMELRWIYSQRIKVGEISDMQMTKIDYKETLKQITSEKRKTEEQESVTKHHKKGNESVIMIDNTVSENILLNDSFETENVAFIPPIHKITSEQERECRNLVEWVLNERLGDSASCVTKYLDMPSQKKNTMAVLNTARASVR